MLDALRAHLQRPHDVRLREAGVDVPHPAVQLGDDVALRRSDPRHRRVLVAVHERRARFERRSRIEHGRQNLVVDDQRATALLGGSLALRDDRRDPLPREPHHAIEHERVVGIVLARFVTRGGEGTLRDVHRGQDVDDAAHRPRGRHVDRHHPRVRVRRAQDLQVQQPFDLDVEREARAARDEIRPGRRRHTAPERLPGRCLLDVAHARDRIADRAKARAPADVALEAAGQVGDLVLVERGDGHDHSRRAEAALKPLRVEEPLLDGVQLVAVGEPRNGRHPATGGAQCREDAAMHGRAVDVHGAGAAVAGIAALLDLEALQRAQVRA